MPSFKTVWKDPVGASVIASVIFASGGAALSTWLKWWPAIGHGLVGAGRWLLASSAVPNWLSILGALALAAVALVVVVGSIAAARPAPRPPSVADYHADHFFGVDWTWRWLDGSYDQIYSACALCPKCQYQLRIRSSIELSRVVTVFHCDSCERIVSMEECHPDDLQSKLVRLIHQKIRNRTWLEVVNQQRRAVQAPETTPA